MAGKEEELSALMRCLEPLDSAFRPILGTKEGSGGKRLEGTATIVAHGVQRFVLTAHHVVKERHKLIGAEGDAVDWPRKFYRLEPRTADACDPDIAWAHARFAPTGSGLDGGIGMALATGQHEPSPTSAYLVAGYPASKGKVRMGDGFAQAKLMVALVDLATPDKVPGHRRDMRTHLCFNYSRSQRSGQSGEPRVGAHPEGMSGGAVFAVGRPAVQPEEPIFIPLLVGILTEFYEDSEILVASRVRNVWEALGLVPALHGPLYRAVGA